MILKEIQFRMSGIYYDLVGADILWLCTKLTIHVRSGLHWNAWLRWTQTWHKEMQPPFLVFLLIKGFYVNRFKQLGLILRSINPQIVFVSSVRKKWTWEGMFAYCIETSKKHILKFFTTVKTHRARASEIVAVHEQPGAEQRVIWVCSTEQ